MMMPMKLLDLCVMFVIPMWVVARSFVLSRPNLIGLVTGLVIIYLLSIFIDCTAINWAQEIRLFQGTLRSNGGGVLFHVVMKLLFIVTITVYFHTENKRTPRSLMMTLLTLGFAGYYVLVLSDDLMISALCIALVSICNYGLIVFGEDAQLSYEAAVKYFFQSSIVMVIFLLGVALMVFTYGSTSLSMIMNSADNANVLTYVGVSLITVAVMFWLGVAPVHQWMPDVYQAAPLPVVSLFAGPSKIAYLFFFLRFLGSFGQDVREYVGGLLLIFALISIIWGGLSALTQNRFLRFIANSSIVQLGFMLCTLVAMKGLNYQGAFFYLLSYALTTTGMIIILTFFHRHKIGYDKISDLAGMYKVLPFLSFFMTLFVLSLAGVPPFIGFFAKIEALRVVMRLPSVVPMGVIYIGMMVSLGYYLKLIKAIYFDEISDEQNPLISLERIRSTTLLTMVLIIGAVVFGYLFIAEIIHKPFEMALLPGVQSDY